MLEKILKLYTAFMATGVRSPMPHLVGPPGCGKSTVVAQAASLVQRRLHTINVSRISPLEIEGVQMPETKDEELALKFLPATFWTQLQDGDILLLDEFLRGFPEVYNGLLDILTSRQVGGFVLPKVFIIAASNSTVAYDKALEDRILHLPVPDPRSDRKEKKRLGQMIVDQLGLLPTMVDSMEINEVLDTEVLPMFDILDSFKSGSNGSGAMLKGSSIRKLIGQAELREVQSSTLAALLAMNNNKAMRDSKPQHVFLADAKMAKAIPTYEKQAKKLVGNDKLTEVQAINLDLNLQLLEMEAIRYQKEGPTTDDAVTDDDDIFDL